MKQIIVGFLFLVASSFHGISQNYQAYQLYTKEGKKTTFEKVLKATKGKKAIFFGELHNDPIAHWLQLELLNYLTRQYGARLVCGSEMFERDNQHALDLYLSGVLTEKTMKDSCRLWPNFKTDYLPMLDSAKAHHQKWIATNIPRKYASLVYKKSLKALDTLSSLEKSWMAPLPFPIDTTLSQYAALMNGQMHMGNNFVYSQAIKDATMAYFIAQNISSTSVFYHLNGAYHSDYFQGILWYLNYYGKLNFTDMLTISTVSQDNISKLDKEYTGKADFILCVPENMTKTH